MAKMRDFNPRAVLVVRKASGLSLGGRRYLQGQVVGDDCVSLRKRQQLYRQNFLCYPHDLPDGAAEAAEAREAAANGEQPEGLEGDGTGDQLSEDGVRTNNEANADAEADASRPEGSEEEADDAAKSEGDDEDNSGEEGSEEPSEPVASKKKAKKKRTRKPKS